MTNQVLPGDFGTNDRELDDLIQIGLCGGGDWCDLYFEDSVNYSLLLRDGEVSAVDVNCDYGCGIRVLKGEKTGYAYAESTDYSSLTRAARAASAISGIESAVRKYYPYADGLSPEPRYTMDRDWRLVQVSEFIPMMKLIDSEIRRREQRTQKVIVSLNYGVSKILMYNSLHELSSDLRPLASLSVTAVFKNGERTETGNSSLSLRAGAECFGKDETEYLISHTVEDVDVMFQARRPKGGSMSVVMAAGASGILLHEAMGHAFEADFNRKGQSVFSNRIGRTICKENINIVDDGTLPGFRGSCTYDDEGVPGQKTYMVMGGKLNSYLHDRISASYYGVNPTGNGRRESFRYNPIPRMRSTYMENGSDGTVDDLVSSVKKGVFVKEFSNGQVKIGEGDFTFFVKSGFLIENGRITMPIKDVNIIGNGPDALFDIVGVASDLVVDKGTWTCGKEQSVPVSCGMPSVLIKNLTVGGI